MDQIKIRQNAVRRYLAGESVTTICQDLGVSRKWFYKWYNRHQAGAENWYEDQSKAPKRCPHKINSAVEKLVLNIRDNLSNVRLGFCMRVITSSFSRSSFIFYLI